MKLQFLRNESLPRLAWLAHSRYANEIIEVIHGPDVETGGKFFVEGVWSAPFDEANFDKCTNVFGTGGRIRKNEIVFVSPAHTLDSLYYVDTSDSIAISNSLPMLLARLNEELPAAYEKYDEFLCSVLRGIQKYETTIKTARHEIRRLIFRNLKFDGRQLLLQDKPLPPPFGCFAEYIGYLDETYSRIVENLRSDKRRIKLDIFSTQSRGYDTTAVNAIASKYGIKKVFTCTKSRDKNAFFSKERSGQPDDDGTEIGRMLGFQCIPIDRLSFVKRFEHEELYFAGHHELSDVNLIDITRQMDNVAVLLTGVRGEIWYGKEFYASDEVSSGSDELKKFDMAGHGMCELRLHVGLIMLPLPFVGAIRQNDIHAITASDEMNPWRLPQTYDRPIPRRIAEERGVPRQLFGQKKLNTTVSFPIPAIPFNAELKREYLDFLIKKDLISAPGCFLLPVVHIINQWIYYSSPNRFRFIYYLERFIHKTLYPGFHFKMLRRRLIGTVYCFCVNKTANRYRGIISSERAPQR